jgi:hypothetical protein
MTVVWPFPFWIRFFVSIPLLEKNRGKRGSTTPALHNA